jgi:uncharacterized membrane protein YhaH (DUF805 family)
MDTFTVVVIGTGVIFFLLTCCAILDIARKDFGSLRKKGLWALITLIPFIGPILYFIIGFRRGRISEQPGSDQK